MAQKASDAVMVVPFAWILEKEEGMETPVEHEAFDGERFEEKLTERDYLDCLTVHGSTVDEPGIVLTDRGDLVFSSREGAAVFGTIPDKLNGRSIRELMRNLPLNPLAPGSNVAYAAFSGRQNLWREYGGIGIDGKELRLEVLLDIAIVNLRYLILMWLRLPGNRSQLLDRSGKNQLFERGNVT